jgi:phenylpyruvate tautomerase PptA (4-oxalocrotonate tautomerase family)
MPITVTAPRGVLTAVGERQILPRLTDVLADVTDVTGTPLVDTIGGTVHLLDAQDIYAGGRPVPLVLVELKLPGVALSTLQRRATFISRATEVVADLTVAEHDDDHTWINVLHAQDGAWGIGGRSLTNAMLDG